jgi:hypothetical protein
LLQDYLVERAVVVSQDVGAAMDYLVCLAVVDMTVTSAFQDSMDCQGNKDKMDSQDLMACQVWKENVTVLK